MTQDTVIGLAGLRFRLPVTTGGTYAERAWPDHAEGLVSDLAAALA
jgi:hypothetical protein